MNILIVTQYFWPERFIINDLAKELIQQGHTVAVLTGKPNYPDGEVYPGYASSNTMHEEYEGVLVYRVPLRPRNSSNFKNLLLNYLSFVKNACIYAPGLLKKQKFDMIFSVAFSPITSVIPAILLKKRLKAPLVIWIQDLWPDSLKAAGYIQNPWILGILQKGVNLIYNCSDLILVQSQGFKKHLEKLNLANPCTYFPNFYTKEQKILSSEHIPEPIQLLFEKHFCILFAGNLGKVQALDTILDAAKKLKDLGDLRILIAGQGSYEKHIQQRILDEHIENVELIGAFPSNMMPQLFAKAKALIVSLKNDPFISLTIPSKIQAYLSSGKPIIASLDGAGADVIRESQAGVVAAAEDASALALAMHQIYSMNETERQDMGQRGLAYFDEHFEMISQTKKLVAILQERVNHVT